MGSKALVILVEEQNKAAYTQNDVFNLLGVKMNIRKNELSEGKKKNLASQIQIEIGKGNGGSEFNTFMGLNERNKDALLLFLYLSIKTGRDKERDSL